MINNLSQFIRAERERRGWTQTYLAKRLGVTQPTVSRLENNVENLTIKTINRALLLFDTNFLDQINQRWVISERETIEIFLTRIFDSLAVKTFIFYNPSQAAAYFIRCYRQQQTTNFSRD